MPCTCGKQYSTCRYPYVNINALLNPFVDDAAVYEPFSNIDGGFKGKNSITYLDVVIMTNDDMRHEIEFVQESDKKELVSYYCIK